jgi:acylphosphatase
LDLVSPQLELGEKVTVTTHLTILGRVQGVWYRGWTRDQARARGLLGWVRNRSNGTVEAVLQGPADKVADMIEACWSGPPAALVRAVEEREITVEDAQVSAIFEQRPNQ